LGKEKRGKLAEKFARDGSNAEVESHLADIIASFRINTILLLKNTKGIIATLRQ